MISAFLFLHHAISFPSFFLPFPEQAAISHDEDRTQNLWNGEATSAHPAVSFISLPSCDLFLYLAIKFPIHELYTSPSIQWVKQIVQLWLILPLENIERQIASSFSMKVYMWSYYRCKIRTTLLMSRECSRLGDQILLVWNFHHFTVFADILLDVDGSRIWCRAIDDDSDLLVVTRFASFFKSRPVFCIVSRWSAHHFVVESFVRSEWHSFDGSSGFSASLDHTAWLSCPSEHFKSHVVHPRTRYWNPESLVLNTSPSPSTVSWSQTWCEQSAIVMFGLAWSSNICPCCTTLIQRKLLPILRDQFKPFGDTILEFNRTCCTAYLSPWLI